MNKKKTTEEQVSARMYVESVFELNKIPFNPDTSTRNGYL